MIKKQSVFVNIIAFIAILSVTAIACNLTSEDSEPTTAGIGNQRMTAEIVSPSSGTAFVVNEPLTVQARVGDPNGTGVTRVELLVNNVVRDQKPSLNPQGDKEGTFNLTWDAPKTPGNYTLAVVPYRNNQQGTAAVVQISVVDSIGATNIGGTSINPTTSGGGGSNVTAVAPTYNPTCRARIDVDRLNFRSSPEVTEDNLIGYFLIDDEAPLIGRLADSTWYEVRALANPNVTGWIYASYSTLLGNCSNVTVKSVATATPTITPSPEPSAEPAKADIVALPPSGLTTLQAAQDGTASAIYTFTVQNIGAQATGDFRVLISLPDGNQRFETLASLEPGETLSFPDGGLSVTFTTPGSLRISYQADIDGVVDESNEGNNIGFIDIEVSEAPSN